MPYPFFPVAGLSNPPLAPHNNQYNREDNCIEQANKSAALPIFVFMVAQVNTTKYHFLFEYIIIQHCIFTVITWLRRITFVYPWNNLYRQPCQKRLKFNVHWIYVFYVRLWAGLRVLIGGLFVVSPCGYIFN